VTQERLKNNLINWEIVSINPSDKNWNWKNLFCFWGNSIQSIIGFSLITSLYLVYELNLLLVFLGCLIGSIIVFVLANLIGKPSQKYGIPFPVLLRTSLGINGAKYIAMSRAIVGIFMFGVQTYFLSKSFGYLIRIALFSLDNSLLDKEIFLVYFLALNIIDWFSFALTISLQIFLFSRGHKFNKSFINFSAITVYLSMILFLIIIFYDNFNYVLDSFQNLLVFENIFIKENLIPLFSISGTIFAFFSILILNFGDFSRYVKNETELKKGNLSLILNLVIFSLFSVLIVIGADIILNRNLENMDRILTSPTDIIGKFDNIFLSVIVLFFIILASSSTNLIANYIPSQNILINFLPANLTLRSSGVVIGLIGSLVGVFWMPLLSQIGILSFIDTIGSFFGPLFAIMVIDYYLVKKREINNKDLFSTLPSGSYYFSGGWHIKALYSLFIGFIFSASSIWNVDLRFLQPFSWLIGALMSSITYYLLASR
jgi:nucleobase:cation symporter-1, NCS1 family